MRGPKIAAGRRKSSAARSAPIRPYTHRVVRDHGLGLWTLEDNTGQTYLAVLARPIDAHRTRVEEEKRATGAVYRLGPPIAGR